MSVYVDKIRAYRDIKGYAARYGIYWSHLFADSQTELDAFAQRLGLAPRWAQYRNIPGGFHYDLIPSKRALAIRLGARAVDDRTMIAIRRAQVDAAKECAAQTRNVRMPFAANHATTPVAEFSMIRPRTSAESNDEG